MKRRRNKSIYFIRTVLVTATLLLMLVINRSYGLAAHADDDIRDSVSGQSAGTGDGYAKDEDTDVDQMNHQEDVSENAAEESSSETAEQIEDENTPENPEDEDTVSEDAAPSERYEVETVNDSQEKDETEAEAEKVNTKRIYRSEVDDISVTAILEYADAVPDEAEFRVTPVTEGEAFDSYMEALDEFDSLRSHNADNTLLYDLAFIMTDDDGKESEYEPADGSVKVRMYLSEDELDRIGVEDTEDVMVTHLPLTEEAKEGCDITLDAEDISASDIIPEEVESNGAGEFLQYKLDSFSIISIGNGTTNNGTIDTEKDDINQDSMDSIIDDIEVRKNVTSIKLSEETDKVFLKGQTKYGLTYYCGVYANTLKKTNVYSLPKQLTDNQLSSSEKTNILINDKTVAASVTVKIGLGSDGESYIVLMFDDTNYQNIQNVLSNDGNAYASFSLSTYSQTSYSDKSDYITLYSFTSDPQNNGKKLRLYLDSQIDSFETSLKKADVILPQDKYTYTGEEIKPVPYVLIGNKELDSNNDYKTAYSNNINVGTASITITGKGNYTDKTSSKFKIVPRSVTGAAITFKNDTVEYTGKTVTNTIKSVKVDSKTLQKDKDYEIVDETRLKGTDVGTYTVTIKGKGNYTGTISAKWKIKKSSQSLISIEDAKIEFTRGTRVKYTGDTRTNAIESVTLNGKELKVGRDYEIVDSSKLKGKSTGTYTVKIRGIGNYTGTAAAEWKIKKSEDSDDDSDKDKDKDKDEEEHIVTIVTNYTSPTTGSTGGTSTAGSTGTSTGSSTVGSTGSVSSTASTAGNSTAGRSTSSGSTTSKTTTASSNSANNKTSASENSIGNKSTASANSTDNNTTVSENSSVNTASGNSSEDKSVSGNKTSKNSASENRTDAGNGDDAGNGGKFASEDGEIENLFKPAKGYETDSPVKASVNNADKVAETIMGSDFRDAVENGAEIEFWIDVKPIESSVSGDVKKLVNDFILDFKDTVAGLCVGRYLDVTVYYQVDKGGWNEAEVVSVPVAIDFSVPESMKGLSDRYYVLCIHDGMAEIMSDINQDPDMITVLTQYLQATYVLLYQDVDAEVAGEVFAPDVEEPETAEKGSSEISEGGAGNADRPRALALSGIISSTATAAAYAVWNVFKDKEGFMLMLQSLPHLKK